MATDQLLADYLRQLRTDARLDLTVLARRVSLSPAQVAQLETGQDSLFYNRRIRQQAARKIISHLGGDPGRVLDEKISHEPDASLERTAPTAFELQACVQPPEVTPPSQAVAAASRSPRRGQAVLVLSSAGALLLATAIWVSQETLFRSLWGGMSATPSRISATHPEPAQTSTPTRIDTSPAVPAVPLDASSKPTEILAELPRLSHPAEASACAKTASDQPPSVQPPQAAKPGDMVYVVSKVDQVVCLLDASGRQQEQRLEAGQSRSFYGQPPWVVHTAQLRETQLFFQGWKVKLPQDVQDRVQLVELR